MDRRRFPLGCSQWIAWILVGLALSPAAPARTLYVSALTGSNANAGTDSGSPLATLQYAEGLTNPGDTVLIMSGTYTSAAPGENILLIDRSGTASAPITYEAYPGQRPILSFSNAWAAVRISANYITIEGLEIVGNAASISASYGFAEARDLLNPLTNGDGIDVSPPPSGQTPHHITIRSMIIHDVPGGGIAADGADYVTIANDLVFNTSNWSPYGDSAISLYEPNDIDDNTGYKNVIEGNITYDNTENVPCVCRDYAQISDGNGIIVDDNRHTQDGGAPYNGRTLIAYNVSFDNGGSGIHAFASQHVDILSNTAYGNNLTSSINEGQIFSASGLDVKIVDNILAAPAAKFVTTSSDNAGSVIEDYNILFDIGGSLLMPIPSGSHDLAADPRLVDPSSGNFSLLPGSPALGSAEPAPLMAATVPASVGVISGSNRGAE